MSSDYSDDATKTAALNIASEFDGPRSSRLAYRTPRLFSSLRFATKARHAGRSIGRALIDLAIPPSCVVCDGGVTEQGTLCPRCWRELRFITPPFCDVLGTPFAYDMGEGAISPAALTDRPRFEKARAAVIYDDIARRMVARLKYEDRTDLAPMMGRLMTKAARDLSDDNPIIMPIPLHRWRLLRRRYNQAALLSLEVAKNLKLEHRPHDLLRFRATRQQVGLSRAQRRNNVVGAFRVTPTGALQISGRSVLLVDDVFTTGATVIAATHACMRAGARTVRVLTFARVAEPLGGPIDDATADHAPIKD